MWTCKHCDCKFEFVRATEKANHSRHCIQNPRRLLSYVKSSSSATTRHNNQYGEYKTFTVVCSGCDKACEVRERELAHPKKQYYYCSRSCANSVGGKAKVEKYGLSWYPSIARKFYVEQCAACGISDILDVHHIDENRDNSEPSNLIFLCPNDHYRLHRNQDPVIQHLINTHVSYWSENKPQLDSASNVQTKPEYFKS